MARMAQLGVYAHDCKGSACMQCSLIHMQSHGRAMKKKSLSTHPHAQSSYLSVQRHRHFERIAPKGEEGPSIGPSALRWACCVRHSATFDQKRQDRSRQINTFDLK